MLQRGDLVPHFTVKTLHGDEFSYATIWQRRNLVLIALPVTDSEAVRRYVSELAARGAEFSAGEGVSSGTAAFVAVITVNTPVQEQTPAQR